MTKQKKKGLFLVIAPIALLILTLILYAIITFIAFQMAPPELLLDSETGLQTESTALKILSIVNVIIGLVGVFAVIGLLIGVPVGIYLLAKKDKSNLAEYKNKPEFKGLNDEQILYITSWSWGAFFGSLVWAIGNRLYGLAAPLLISFILSFTMPFVFGTGLYVVFYIFALIFAIINLIIWLYLSIKGKHVSWQKGWVNFDVFKQRQRILAWIIVVFLLITIGFTVYMNIRMMNNFSSQFDLEGIQACIAECADTTGNNDEMSQCLTSCQQKIKLNN